MVMSRTEKFGKSFEYGAMSQVCLNQCNNAYLLLS